MEQTKPLNPIADAKISVSRITDAIIVFLLVLMFVSKISLKWTRVVPFRLSFVIYQYGLSPYINFALNFGIFAILFFIWVRTKKLVKLSPLYLFYMYTLMVVLTLQTLFQIALINVSYSPWMQLGGLLNALVLLTMYGIMIPTMMPLERFIYIIRRTSVILVLLSLLLLPLFFPHFFRGGRFIGVFKHIPHMVSAATFAFIFFIPSVFRIGPYHERKNKFLFPFILFLIALVVLLTATKAAVITILLVFFVATLIYGSKKKTVRLFKFCFVLIFTTAVLLFGVPTGEFIYDVATGHKSFGMRPAQDGIESRMEEVTRGIKMFKKSEYFGQGILYKFMGGEGVEMEGYNSFKDPHNLFISAGVIGGWPLLLLSIIGYFMMIMGTLKALVQKDPNRQMLGLFLLSHLPVFVIYHVHLSLGGLGDRMYYLIFGYLALIWSKSSQFQEDSHL